MEEKAVIVNDKISMEKAKKVANQLKTFCSDNNLIVNIAGKDYMMAEGWQFCGTHFGLTDIVEYCDPVQSEKEIKYKSSVIVINQMGTTVSRGIAYCSDKEKKKKGFEEYSVASMSQTRAIGKAYRNILSWVVKMAGYEATPAEEMDKDSMETDLSKSKQNVVKIMNEMGITDSQQMLLKIKEAIGKTSIETLDDANNVQRHLYESN